MSVRRGITERNYEFKDVANLRAIDKESFDAGHDEEEAKTTHAHTRKCLLPREKDRKVY